MSQSSSSLYSGEDELHRCIYCQKVCYSNPDLACDRRLLLDNTRYPAVVYLLSNRSYTLAPRIWYNSRYTKFTQTYYRVYGKIGALHPVGYQ